MEKQENHIHQLASYIRKNLEKGYPLDALRYSLISQGYSRISVDNAIDIANKQIAASLPKLKEKPQITYKLIEDDSEKIVSISEKPRPGFFKKIKNLFTGE